jgi:SAM-dependent methyltransferase
MDAASKHWNEKHVSRDRPDYRIRDWTESAHILRNYINPLISGSPEIGWLEHVVRKFVRGKNLKRALDLGCGPGQFEQATLPGGVLQHVEAFDFSAKAIEQAQRQSLELGYSDRVVYRCENFETTTYPNHEFDFVLIAMALHHVLNLELVLENIKRWKKPKALFVAFEYVGPNRFQWKPEHAMHLERLLRGLPERYRIHGMDGHLVTKPYMPRLIEMLEGDPSESIRSADIMGLLSAYFELVERRDFGGTILQPLLADIVHNFEPEVRSEDAEILQALFVEEQRLIASGELANHFTLVVCR